MKVLKRNQKNGQSLMYKNFLIICCLLVISRSYDFITTYLYTPDLKNETNVLVKAFNLNYYSLFFIQISLLSFVIYCFYFYTFRKYEIPKANFTSLKDFIPFFHFKKKEKFVAFLYKQPIISSILYSVGYIVTYSLIFIGFIVGTSTLLLLLSEDYKQIYKLGGPYVLYTILVLIVLFFTYKFYKKEFFKSVNKEKLILPSE